MKWHAQVAHIVRKDLYLSRWLLVAYGAVVLGVTAVAVGWLAPAPQLAPLLTFCLMLLAMILLALLIQADSPQRVDSFWVTLPLRGSAMFAAKITGAILFLLVLPLLGQFAGLSAHAVGAGDLPGLLGSAALVFGAWLGVAAVLAALTRDLRTFMVALVLVPAGGIVGMLVFGRIAAFVPAGFTPPRLLIPAVALGGALLVLADLYITRNARRATWIAALLGVFVVSLPPAADRSAPAASPAGGSIPDLLRPATLRATDVRFHSGGEATLGVQIRGSSASHQYLLVSPAVYLQMGDGSLARVELRSGDDSEISLNHPVSPLGEGLVWLGERNPDPEFTTGVAIVFSPDQRRALESGDAELMLQGRLEVREARVMGDLPLETGTTGAFGGRRVRLLEVEHIEGQPTVGLQISSVASPRAGGGTAPFHRLTGRPTAYALVNQRSHEAYALTERGSSGSGFGLVLPGNESWTATIELQPEQTLSDVRVETDWLRNARLLIMDWVAVGSDTVRIQATITAADSRSRRRSGSD